MNKYWFVCLLLLTVAACRVTRDTPLEVRKMRDREIIRRVTEQEVNYTTLSARLKIDYAANEQMTSFKGDLRVYRDSAIWMSIKPALGLEVARILITTDSVQIIDRINRQYLSKPIHYIASTYKVPLDFALLQSIITGGLFYRNHKDIEANIVDNAYQLVYESDSIRNVVVVDPVNFTIRALSLYDIPGQRTVDIDYLDYRKVSEQWFTHNRNLVVTEQETYQLSLEFSRVILNEPVALTFVVGDNYETID
jgi:hypothetical protein